MEVIKENPEQKEEVQEQDIPRVPVNITEKVNKQEMQNAQTPNQNQVKYFAITEQDRNVLIAYLGNRPFQEVEQGIVMLRNLKEIKLQ